MVIARKLEFSQVIKGWVQFVHIFQLVPPDVLPFSLNRFSGYFLWTLFVDTFYKHFFFYTLFTFFVASIFGHLFWTQFVDTFCGQFLWTLFVATFCGNFFFIYFFRPPKKIPLRPLHKKNNTALSVHFCPFLAFVLLSGSVEIFSVRFGVS